MEKKWYQSSYYRTLLDMHIEDWDASFLSEFDPDYYVEQVKKAQIDAVSSPFAFCFTTSQFSGARPACPSRIFCLRVGFLPRLMICLFSFSRRLW